jgi:polyhydroxyalkanoate synthase subunit PhaC
MLRRWNKSCLYRYDAARRHSTPLLFVPNLGISRPYIYDLLLEDSFFEYLTEAGFDLYLLDWGVFGEEDWAFDLEGALRVLARAWDEVCTVSGADEVSVMGYCLGLPIATSLIAARPELKVRSLVSLAGPVDFTRAGLFPPLARRSVVRAGAAH